MNFVEVFAVGYQYQLAVGYLAVYFVVHYMIKNGCRTGQQTNAQ